MKFLGIDLGWVRSASGLCCIEWTAGKLEILDVDCLVAIADILAWIDNWVAPNEPAMIAVDAPTLIPNATGTRLPDCLTHKYFGRYHAGCYPANLSRPFAQRTVGFGLELEARGFAHAPTIIPQQLGRYQIEVFPHPAIVHLFGLDRILKYKKGKLAERHPELIKLCQYIANILPTREPALNLSKPRMKLNAAAIDFILQPSDFIFDNGAALKVIEDQLDSLICAYVAAHWWYWGLERNWVLGDRTTGYIIVPAGLGVHSVYPDDTTVNCPKN